MLGTEDELLHSLDRLADLVPDLPRSFDLVEGDLIQGATLLLIRYRVPGVRGWDPREAEVYLAPVRASVHLDGRAIHVGWWVVGGLPPVIAWVG